MSWDQSRGLSWIPLRQVVQNIDELINERLAFETEKEMLEMAIREVRGSAGICPQLHYRYMGLFLYMRLFLAHKVLDWNID
jgi:hypothetical protein